MLRYPRDIVNQDTDYVDIKIYKYKAPFSSQGFGDNASVSGYNQSVSDLGTIKESIILYMPEDIQAQYGANWEGKNISSIGRGILGTGGGLSGNDLGVAFKAMGETIATVGEGLTQGTVVANLVSNALKEANFDTLSTQDIFSGGTGRIFNPNTEVIYQGPQMRTFTLNFKLQPKNSPEAQEIKKIISAFKKAMLPKYNEGSELLFGTIKGKDSQGVNLRGFVGVPDIVDVKFKRGGANHPYVSQFKPCAITSVDVNYTPDGAWATYTDGSPVATSLSLGFQELKMVYAEEIDQGGY